MVSSFELNLIMARGLRAEAAWELRRHAAAGLDLRGGVAPRRGVCWPGEGAVLRLRERAEAAGLSLAWRGDVEYPIKLTRRMGEAAPAWVWLRGARRRLVGPACAMIGARHAVRPAYLRAAGALAEGLAAEGVTIVSGLAAGSDASAHEGALRGDAGTVAIPARGLLSAVRGSAPEGMTLLGLDLPDTSFSAGLAIRRNALIPALSEALILVSSELKGGSAHAVNWAARRGLPLYTFVGRRGTPEGNRSLISAGLARPLDLGDGVEAWLAALLPVIRSGRAWQPYEAARTRASQPSLFGE